MSFARHAARLAHFAAADATRVQRLGDAHPRTTWAPLAACVLEMPRAHVREAWFALHAHVGLAHPASTIDEARGDLLAFAHDLPAAFAAHLGGA